MKAGLILLAEDCVMLRNLIRSNLEHEAYDVMAASDGSEAVELSRAINGTIDLFLTDVEMPFMDGISAYRQISLEQPDVKVLFMSGEGRQPKLPKRYPFLPKPFILSLLHKRMKEVLAVHPPARSDSLKVILVVDPQQARRERTTNILNENGYAVLTAKSAEEAEAISDSIARIDLIISEVVFGGNSGVHLAEHADASERNLSTLLISHFHPDILHKVSGFSRQPEFLSNPFTEEALLTRVSQLLERQPRPQ